jgi:hypothetical protein
MNVHTWPINAKIAALPYEGQALPIDLNRSRFSGEQERAGKKRRSPADRSGTRNAEADDADVKHHPHHRRLNDAAKNEKQVGGLKNFIYGILKQNIGHEDRDADEKADQRGR